VRATKLELVSTTLPSRISEPVARTDTEKGGFLGVAIARV
jgi:hypothetical protein